MWGYQSHFRVLLEHRAETVLKSIAPTVHPKAVLVGVRTPEKTDGHPVCVEPEDEDLDPKIFFSCAARTDNIYKSHPDQKIFYGDKPRMRDKPENIRKKSAREAVQEVVSAYDLQNGTYTFCGWPTRVEGYYVVPILQFNREKLLEYPHLPEPIRFDKSESSTGLLQSVTECLLEEATDALEKKEPGRFFGVFPLESTAILQDAGNRFCYAITFCTSDIMRQELFKALNAISSLPYEGREAVGKLLFVSSKVEALDFSVRLKDAVSINNHKLCRKLIEISNSSVLCVCQGANAISGFGSLRSADADCVFQVDFVGRYKWDLCYKNKLVMKVAFGMPYLPLPRINEEVFRSDMRRIIPSIIKDAEDRIWNIIKAGIEQKHGTMIVVSTKAVEEAERLKKQCLSIYPIALTPDLVSRFSGIDGAILIDPKGICHAIGVILDGMATDEGDQSRGARYNSAIRYIASAGSPTICIVVSEDGNVNVLPELFPQIDKNQVAEMVTLLESHNMENYNKTISWLNEHRFYLTKEQCDAVNAALKQIQSVPPTKAGEIRMKVPPFVPHSDMNESYYLKESS